ncbi:hypothetical protein CSW21_05465 [Thermus scotoductus]|uniref:IclR-ED domain-containing protein n=1 Tax=Thermus scotoductus TaxID=37636 RepID=A0A430RAW0_THESC|nr:hypothetical protein CSW49_05120 [Thermus scotoductus]RTH04526.1 hypothetical protein CSW45_05095 [Thermus scotoductus]RTH16452.1 hypothetical protein CSW42_13010 [Thermus scotoductus]RTI00600.1 hypothetical protein CSW28_05290 [Thermus scotoductus]RTI22703.1 hypothetical protein CSW21_05465 [Thermus scotoductus]
MSTLPEEAWPRHFVSGFQRTSNTIADLERFLEEIRRVAQQGYALDMEENEPGIRCIAAPIYDAGGRGVGSCKELCVRVCV